VLRYGTNLGTALQLAQFRDDAASQERAVAGLGGAVQKRINSGSRNAVRGVKYPNLWSLTAMGIFMQLINPTVPQDGGMQQTKPPFGHPSEMLRLSRSRSAQFSGILYIYMYNRQINK
jgi:hypothetical protein